MQEQEKQHNNQLEGGTYEIIQSRLQKHKQDLIDRLKTLNTSRKEVFGAIETKLIANDRINTENTCIARDIVTLHGKCLLGYNVHFGLRTEIKLDDVFSVYEYKEGRFQVLPLDIINDDLFITDFKNLYKYYRNTFFAKFAIIGNYLHMVFQISESIADIKTFKWLIEDNRIVYVDNRSDHEYRFPRQHEFKWQETNYDMHRYGDHPHVSILDKIFVETVGGDLTIKIEDNTDEGRGILQEPVEHKDQTLEDAKYLFADLGNLTVLSITPYQETARYFVYNHKVQEVKRIQSIQDTAVLLPDNQGLIFPDGYYLQTGEFKKFERSIDQVKFQQKIASPNGEDYLYVFYEEGKGDYVLMTYNIIEQTINTPIICNGFTVLENGELCYFKAEEEATKHHVIQIWQTPFSKTIQTSEAHTDSLLYKIGNKDIVQAMAECQEIITLLNKEDNYGGLYDDISKQSTDVLDSYYWIREPDTANLDIPLAELKSTANSAIDEFEKVVQLKKAAAKATQEVQDHIATLFDKIKHASFKSIDDFVEVLTALRTVQGENISLKEIRYTNIEDIDRISEELKEQTERISRRCVDFLLDEKALLPYQNRIQEKKGELESVKKVIEAKKLEEEINQISADLEMLIDIVNNLDIEDTSHSTKIIDTISLLFAEINQLKAELKRNTKALSAGEAKADFVAQLKLFDQSIINYIDIATTPEKCDDYLTKLSVQLEELEGKFADFDEYIAQIMEKREEVYSAFETRKNTLVEAKNKKALALLNASERILKSIGKKAETFNSADEINGYFASDLMVNKLHSIIEQLKNLDDIGKAESLESKLKTTREEVIRKLKDKLDLYEDGENVIKLGKHKFGVNKQPLDLNIVNKSEELYFHLTGTDFYEKINSEILANAKDIWNQELVSENNDVYRAEYLAYSLYTEHGAARLNEMNADDLKELVKKESSENYSEGYVKGVHDEDAFTILSTLIKTEENLGLLQYDPKTRAYAQFFWNSLHEEDQETLDKQIKASGSVLQVFPNSSEYQFVIEHLMTQIDSFFASWEVSEVNSHRAATYLFDELFENNNFIICSKAIDLRLAFKQYLQTNKGLDTFERSIELLTSPQDKVLLAKQWLQSFIDNKDSDLSFYLQETICLLLFNGTISKQINHIPAVVNLNELKGGHPVIVDGVYTFNYHTFVEKMRSYSEAIVTEFLQFRETKKQVALTKKKQLKLEEFKPRVLSSFVRNKLIDQVYLPLFGDNLSKQIGTVGDNKRTDNMGMLLLISPPGYGKTTLMEYIAERLGLVFMKINGPAIGHEVTSVDPMAANNSATRQELEKLNLSFEMGNNVMLYLDDIQHCNPEFLQKFISLADGQRKIEGIYNGETKTYDFRGKKFCVVMAGNPYTESGEKFRIPDMLANRADIYNLGDIIGDTAELFKLSLIENALTSNDLLRQLSSKNFEDIYSIINYIEQGSKDNLEVTGNHTKQELQDYVSTLEKVITIRDTVLKVNEQYIKSAAMEDAYRTEPSFKLQGSYRDMNKLVAKVVPIMNEQELQTVLLSHYESESQTLTSAAEANLLKYKEMTAVLNKEELSRWEAIKDTFVKNNKLKGFGDQNEMAQVLGQLMQFSDNLEGIKEVLEKGLKRDE
ncbi:MAG: DNA repair ATPase [Flavobacteriaceae bacterium]|nr:DNA repair ATPase [Flavobacteriaceae bacterium]